MSGLSKRFVFEVRDLCVSVFSEIPITSEQAEEAVLCAVTGEAVMRGDVGEADAELLLEGAEVEEVERD